MKKKILVISQYFYPEEFRINDICKEWVKKGYEVTVVTGIPNYPEGKTFSGYGLIKKRRETFEGIQIIRLPIIPRGKNSVMLILNYLSFVISGFFWQWCTKIVADYVFIFEVSPMTQALPGVWFAKKRKIPCYLYVQDLWPENVEIITGIKSRFVITPIGKMVDYIYKNCNKIFATSESFVKAIMKRNVPGEKVEFWPQYAEDFYIPLKLNQNSKLVSNDKFNIIFAGNIGEAQGLEILPRAASLLSEKNKGLIQFTIVGDGRFKEDLIKIIEEKNLENMFNFIPKQPANKIPILLASCDVAFLSFIDNPLFEMTIPAKLQSYMACGIPIIASASGETERIIKDSNCGVSSAPGDFESLAKNITKLLELSPIELKKQGQNARQYYEWNFNKLLLLKKMDTYFT